MHWVAVAMLTPGTQHRMDCESFAQGHAPSPWLKRMLARFRWALTTDRIVEALHAGSKLDIGLASHVGGVHIAFHSAIGEILQVFKEGADRIQLLADCCKQARNVLKGLHMCGLRLL